MEAVGANVPRRLGVYVDADHVCCKFEGRLTHTSQKIISSPSSPDLEEKHYMYKRIIVSTKKQKGASCSQEDSVAPIAVRFVQQSGAGKNHSYDIWSLLPVWRGPDLGPIPAAMFMRKLCDFWPAI